MPITQERHRGVAPDDPAAERVRRLVESKGEPSPRSGRESQRGDAEERVRKAVVFFMSGYRLERAKVAWELLKSVPEDAKFW